MDAIIEMDNCRQACVLYWGWIKRWYSKLRLILMCLISKWNPGVAFHWFNLNSPDVDAMQRKLLESRGSVAQARSNAV